MKKLMISLTLLAATTINAQTLVCFTRNEPVDSEIITLPDREIYFTNNEGNYSITILSVGEKLKEMSCQLGDGFGISTHYNCGSEDLYLDVPNNAGLIKQKTDDNGEYASQPLVCRDQTHLVFNSRRQ